MNTVVDSYYNNLTKEILLIDAKVKDFGILYNNEDKSVIDLLNDIAPTFFWNIEHAMFDDIVIRMAKILDPSVQGRNENYTLETMINECTDNRSLYNKLKPLLDNAKDNFEKLKTYRNKELAHRDKNTYLSEEKVNMVNENSLKIIKETLDSMILFMNVYEGITGKVEISYEMNKFKGGSENLLNKLKCFKILYAKKFNNL